MQSQVRLPLYNRVVRLNNLFLQDILIKCFKVKQIDDFSREALEDSQKIIRSFNITT